MRCFTSELGAFFVVVILLLSICSGLFLTLIHARFSWSFTWGLKLRHIVNRWCGCRLSDFSMPDNWRDLVFVGRKQIGSTQLGKIWVFLEMSTGLFPDVVSIFDDVWESAPQKSMENLEDSVDEEFKCMVARHTLVTAGKSMHDSSNDMARDVEDPDFPCALSKPLHAPAKNCDAVPSCMLCCIANFDVLIQVTNF